MGWLIALAIASLLAILPLGVFARYDSSGPLVRAILGPVWLTLYPRPKKEKKTEKTKSEEKVPEKTPDPQPQPEPQPKSQPQPAPKPAPRPAAPEKSGGSWTDFLPLVELALDLLGDLRRKLRVNLLELKLTMAADDPCDLAVNYGRANAALGNLMPQLERIFVIKKRDVEIQCDFTAEQTVIYARMELSITLGRLLSLIAVYGVRALKEFLKLRKIRKGGA